jgi:8-oxo-dGTP pyrophosphatase MutT (NUDIX family)
MRKKRVVKVVATALVWKDGRLLILKRASDFESVRRGKGLWEPPGGGIRPNEQVETSLRRELREETGLTISRHPVLVTTCSYVLADETTSVHRLHFVYAVQLRGRTKVRLSDEHASRRWVRSPKELARFEMIPRMRKLLVDQMQSEPSED